MIITIDQVKEQLGISSSEYDTAITAKLPYIDAKVKQITRNHWQKMISGTTENGSAIVRVSDYVGSGYDYILDDLMIGQQLVGTGVPADAYISDIYPEGTTTDDNYPQIQMSGNATASGTVKIHAGFPITYFDIVAKGVWFLINGTSTTLPNRTVKSKSMGPVSITYSDEDSKLDAKYGMPSWFVKGLPRYMGGI